MNDLPPRRSRARTNWLAIVLGAIVVYLLSSGPLIALGFWLREQTRWDGFYAVMWLYFPLLIFGHNNPIAYYINWWVVDVFDTVGPG